MNIVSVAIGEIRERSRRAVLAVKRGARSVTGRSAPNGNTASTERLSPGEPIAKLSPSVRHGWKQAADMRLAGIAASAVGIAVLAVAAGIWLADENREDSFDLGPTVMLLRTSPDVMTAIDVEPAAGGEETPPPADEIDVRLAAPSIERTVEAELPAWRQFAVEVATADRTGPMIALVVDDMGIARHWSRQVVALPAPLTLAYLPYADDLAIQTDAARRAGHELLVHIPMEPDDEIEDTGPNALFTDLDDEEIQRRLEWNLTRFGSYVGVNNHMGSRFTRDSAAMSLVLAEIEKRGLLFLDSRTIAGSLGWRMARDAGIPSAKRDIFIDNDADVEKITRQLDRVEALAIKNGYAVGIGHPRPATLRALAEWLPDVVERGFTLVPISIIVAHRNGIDLAAARSLADGSVK